MKYPYLLFLIFSVQLASSQTTIWLVDPLEAIYPDANNLEAYSSEYRTNFAQNSPVDVHLVVKTLQEQAISLTASLNGKNLPSHYWAQLIDVPVEQNTGLDSRTEQFKNQINPHVIRRAPFRIYEIIQALPESITTSNNNFDAYRLQIPASEFQGPGQYEINISVKTPTKLLKAVFAPTIHAAKVPDLADGKFFYTNWFNINKMEDKHSLERWSVSWFSMLNQYAQLMAHGRQNCIIIPGELIRFENGVFSLDEERMLQFIDIFRKYGFQYFESPHLMYRGAKDDWGDPELKVRLTQNGYFSKEGKEDVATIMKLIKSFTLKHNLTHNWLQHISDEPTKVNAQCYKDVVKQVKSIYPEIKIMEATNDREGIAGAVDLWCPLINDFEENTAFFREREKLEEKVLVYTCLIPGGKWLNRTMDMEKLRQVYFGWGAAHYNTFGYLHWGLNQYKADPFTQSVVHHPSPAASANNFLPAGDTHVVYPGEKGPLSSIRFEAHRIGIEDYELLEILKSQSHKKAQKLIGKLFTSYTDYNLSIKQYRKAKRKLLKEIKN